MRSIELRVLCEGYTETNFVTQILHPHLRERGIWVKAEGLRRGKYGVVAYDTVRNAIKADVGRLRDHQFVSTMIDLYAIGQYPGAARIGYETPYERVQRIEVAMAQGLPNQRFIPYIQLHEFEALVLVDLDELPKS